MDPSLLTLAAGSAAGLPAWRVLTQVAYFVGLACVIGFTTVHTLVLRPALRRHGDGLRTALRRRSRILVAASGVLVLVTSYLQLAGRVARAQDGPPFGLALTPSAIATFLRRPSAPGEWISLSALFVVQNILVIVLAALLMSQVAQQTASRTDLILAAAAPLAILTSLISSVPTRIAVTREDVLDRGLTQVHIVGGMVWIGGVVMLAFLTWTGRTSLATATAFWSEVWQRFSRLALIAVGGVLVSGSWLTYRHVGALSQLWTTTFGEILLIKFVLVACLLAAGALNEFVLIPRAVRVRPADAPGSVARAVFRRFPVAVSVEVLLGLGVLIVVPFLTGSARAQAGTPTEPEATGNVFLVAVLLVTTIVVSFVSTAKISSALARRDAEAVP